MGGVKAFGPYFYWTPHLVCQTETLGMSLRRELLLVPIPGILHISLYISSYLVTNLD